MSTWKTNESDQLFSAILALQNKEEAERFFRDLLTESEIAEFGNRWKAAKMLDAKYSYTQIEKETGLSSATVARIAKWLNGEVQGYRLVLDRIHHAHTP